MMENKMEGVVVTLYQALIVVSIAYLTAKDIAKDIILRLEDYNFILIGSILK